MYFSILSIHFFLSQCWPSMATKYFKQIKYESFQARRQRVAGEKHISSNLKVLPTVKLTFPIACPFPPAIICMVRFDFPQLPIHIIDRFEFTWYLVNKRYVHDYIMYSLLTFCRFQYYVMPFRATVLAFIFFTTSPFV